MIEAALLTSSAKAIARAVADRRAGARAIVIAALKRIEKTNPRVNAFTDVVSARALARADAIDKSLRAGECVGPLAGVPFAVKNLFDVAGLPTRAGSKINRDRPPARDDGELVRRMEDAGAILVGALNMGEYAYDFTGENCHDGPSRNPHDLARMSGGSSGGTAAAVAAGLVPIALGSDTNGSIRIPSAFCGLFGLKPTFGRLSRAGTFPFVGSLDCLGPIARTVGDLALAYDAMQGYDPKDPGAIDRPLERVEEAIEKGLGDLRIAVCGGYFGAGGDPRCIEAVSTVARALGTTRQIEFPEPARARAAAYVVTAAEGAALHLDRLRARAEDFDPVVRDRLIAGAMIPSAMVRRAHQFRQWLKLSARRLFEEIDVFLAPTAPCRAPAIGQTSFALDGITTRLRPNIGVYTQPLSFIGLPVACVPVWLDEGLPFGVQIVGAPWREDHVLTVARQLEKVGGARSPIAELLH